MLHLGQLALFPVEGSAQCKLPASFLPIAFKDLLFLKPTPHGKLRQILYNGGIFLPQPAACIGNISLESGAGQHRYTGQSSDIHRRRILHKLRCGTRSNGISDEGFIVLEVPANVVRQRGKALAPHAVDKVGITVNQRIRRLCLGKPQQRLHRLRFKDILIYRNTHELCTHDLHLATLLSLEFVKTYA